jgi:hypothetical protein
VLIAAPAKSSSIAEDQTARTQATAAGDFDTAELEHGKQAVSEPSFVIALLPLIVVIVVNFLMSLVILPRMDFAFLEDEMWGGTSIRAVGGVWSVVLALAAGSLAIVICNRIMGERIAAHTTGIRQAHRLHAGRRRAEA